MEPAYVTMVGGAAAILMAIPFAIFRTVGKKSCYDAFAGGPGISKPSRCRPDIVSAKLSEAQRMHDERMLLLLRLP